MGVAQHSCMRFLMNHPVSLKGSCHRFPIPACIYLPAEPLSKVFQCVLIYVYAVILDWRCYEIGKSRLCKLSVVILKFFPYRFICKRMYFFAKRIKVAHYVADIVYGFPSVLKARLHIILSVLHCYPLPYLFFSLHSCNCYCLCCYRSHYRYQFRTFCCSNCSCPSSSTYNPSQLLSGAWLLQPCYDSQLCLLYSWRAFIIVDSISL